MYTFREVKTGKAYKQVLLDLGWVKPRKNDAVFQKPITESLVFEANFLYDYSDHKPGRYKSMPVFRVVSLPWRKKARRLPLENKKGDVKLIAPGHKKFKCFTGGDTLMHYLLPNGEGPTVGVFQRFDAVVDKFSAGFNAWDLLDITVAEVELNRQYSVLSGILGHFSLLDPDSPKVTAFYRRITDDFMVSKPEFHEDWETVAQYFNYQ